MPLPDCRREGRFPGESGNLPVHTVNSFSRGQENEYKPTTRFILMKNRCLLTVFLAFCSAGIAFAQISLKGKVTDEKGRPVPGAYVRLENTTIGCAADENGAFALRHIPDGQYTVRASSLNYEPAAQKINGSRDDLHFRLKESYINLNQVVVSGTGTHHKLKDSPVAVDVISGADIKRAATPTFEEAMTMLNPSISFFTNGAGTNMTLNGLTDKYILVLENGKRMAGDMSGGVDLGRIDMSRVKRIEVVKGAASALYGSDAIGGVINIITDESKAKIDVASDTRYSRNNRFIQSVNAGVNAGKFGSFTSYQRQQADGWQLNPMTLDKKGNLVETDKEASTAFYSNSVNQRFTYDATKRLSLYARGSYFNTENDRPVTEYKYNIAHENITYGAGAKYLLGNSAYIDADFYGNHFSSSNEYIRESGKFVPGDSELRKRLRYYNASVKGVFRAGRYNKITAGLEYVNEHQKNIEDFYDGDKNMYTAAFLAQDEIRIEKLQVVAGFRYIYHKTFKNRFTPNVSAMYPVGNFNFRASYASGFRTPTLQQLYGVNESSRYVTINNADLKPEKSNYFSLGAEYVYSRFMASVSVYHNTVSDMIAYTVLEEPGKDRLGLQQYDNIQKARIKGFDISFNGYLGSGFSVGGGYNFADARDAHSGERLDKSLKHAASVTGNWMHAWNRYRLNVNVNGRIQGVRYSHSYGDAPKFQLWNLNTTHTITGLGGFILEPGAGVENIFNYKDDRPWNSNYATLTPGRTFYIRLSVRFKQ